MDVILQSMINEYCEASDEDRGGWVGHRTSSHHRPVGVLPLFEVCRAVYFGAKAGRFPPRAFRECWDFLALDLFGLSEKGFPLHVNPSAESEWDIVLDLDDLGLNPDAEMSDIPEGGREPAAQEPGMTRRFRGLSSKMVETILGWPEASRGWQADPPDETTKSSFPAANAGDSTMVLDTNHLLDLLPNLPLEGCLNEPLRLPPRLPEAAIRRYRSIFATYGATGKLIIPLCVAEETGRKALNEPEIHGVAGKVLYAIAEDPSRPLWNVFQFDPLSQKTLDAFLYLLENLIAQEVDGGKWPSFGDALVLSHGLVHGCHVASNEWHEKDDWKAVDKLFGHLNPRWKSLL